MTTYIVTTSNWNDAAFWNAISESGPGHTIDFSGLPSNFEVDFWPAGNEINISDGMSNFAVGDTGAGTGLDAYLDSGAELDFFTSIIRSDGNDIMDGADSIVGDYGDDSLSGGDGGDTIYGDVSACGEQGNDTLDGSDGDDILEGVDDADTIVLDGGMGDGVLDDGAANDTFLANFSTGVGNSYTGGEGSDFFRSVARRSKGMASTSL